MEHLDRMVAERVRQAMAIARFGPAELARRSGLPASDLRRRLSAVESFTLFELVRIAAALDCRAADFVPREGEW
ncbi:helix-turn-helix domain-containing protein [Nocardia arthritidis]|uniref:Helix-turn-helix domain-containing protein n=1 Tax=Nocardia arthritidis TaxID=228602 RepID=A0A6G9YTF0_9NOCA|nr:helix-turn-helix transcriptional regulator [Nocardia arthritidis]QIS16605.1 helix-turn-helix domain-containing protein [Nocardia arthritidis]